MNLSLVDPFTLAQEYPENLQFSLRSGHSTCIRFNRKGDLLASGRLDGVVCLFDMETSGLARVLKGHVRQIQSLSWSSTGRYLLSTSQDWKAILWDLQDGSRVRSVRFDSPIYIGELHPHNHLLFVASLFEDVPQLVDMTNEKSIKYILPSAPKRPQTADAEEGEIDEKRAAQDAKQLTTASVFTHNGNHIVTGTNKGWINIIDTTTREVVYSIRLTSGCITYIRLTSSGRDMVVNANDRVLRTLQVPNLELPPDEIEMEVEHKFQDVVNRLLWNHCAFSSTGDYLTASTFKNHDIYIWERKVGSLVKILEGPKEELGVVEWHPIRPLISAVGLETGRIYVWSNTNPQRWSALAPDFHEVEENVFYEEREDEFDIRPKEEVTKRRLYMEEEKVDVLGLEPGLGKSESLDDDGWTMPVVLDLDDTDSESDTPLRKKSPGMEKEKAAGSGGRSKTKKKRKVEE